MITGLLLSILLGFLNFILGLLPTATLDTSLSSGITSFVTYVYQFNGFFPIDTALKLVGYAVAFWLLVFSWDFFKWVVHLIRGN